MFIWFLFFPIQKNCSYPSIIAVMQVGKASVDEITVPDRQKTSNSWIAESATEIKLKKNICNGK